MRVRVRVPATAGNMGSAFDSLGIAFSLYNEILVETGEHATQPGLVQVEGEGASALSTGEPNLVQKAMEYYFTAIAEPVPPYQMSLINRIPFWRGLGSSAAAVAGGLVIADTLVDGKMGREGLLRLAVPLEGHPDNVAPALYGGAVLTVFDEGRVTGPLTAIPYRIPDDWRAVLYIPDLIIPTKQARALLPREIPRADAIYNASRVGLLASALAMRRPELLRVAMQDRLHQPYRATLFPEMPVLIEAALEGGAWGACLSGAGSAILAICEVEESRCVAAALEQAAEQHGIAGYSTVLEIPADGPQVEVEP